MFHKENQAKINRLRRAIDTVRAELAELAFALSDEKQAILRGGIDILEQRIASLSPPDTTV